MTVGERGYTGNGIASISKTETVGLVDTYTITFTDGNTTTFTVTNARSITNIAKTNTNGLVDIYTITYNDGTTSTFDVTNGKGILNIAKTGSADLIDTYRITYNDGTYFDYNITNGEDGEVTEEELQDMYEQMSSELEDDTETGTSVDISGGAYWKVGITPKGNTSQEVIEGVTGTEVTGTDITISDYDETKESKFTKFSGDTFQQTYTGKNIFETIEILGSSSTYVNGVLTIASATYNKSKKIAVNGSSDYTLSVINNNTNTRVYIREFDENDSSLNIITKYITTSAIFTTNSNSAYIIIDFAPSSTDNFPIVISNIQLEARFNSNRLRTIRRRNSFTKPRLSTGY